jgi:hypothetical protein
MKLTYDPRSSSVINTCNFDNPTSEPYKITDFLAAYFATEMWRSRGIGS